MLRTITHSLRLPALLLVLGVFSPALWSQSAALPPPTQSLTPEQYLAELRTASSALDGSDPTSIHAFRSLLPEEWLIRVDGHLVTVKTDWLATALLMEENDLSGNLSPGIANTRVNQARQRLAALREAAEGFSSPSPDSSALQSSRVQLDGILRDREFQGAHGPSWLDTIKARIQAWISRQFRKLFGRMGISATVGNTIAWTLVSLSALLLAFWAVRSLIAAASRSEIDLSGAAPVGQDWRFWAAEARASAGRSDYRAAIHAAYWAAVARLEENRLLPQDRSRTPREALRLVGRGNAAYSPLAQLTRRFELTWYGYHAATPADWDDAMQQLETLGCLRSSTPATAAS